MRGLVGRQHLGQHARRCRARLAAAAAAPRLSPVSITVAMPCALSFATRGGGLALTASPKASRPSARRSSARAPATTRCGRRLPVRPRRRRASRRCRRRSPASAGDCPATRFACRLAGDAAPRQRLLRAGAAIGVMPAAAASASTARASGCSLPACSAAAIASTSRFCRCRPPPRRRPRAACRRSACRSCRTPRCDPVRQFQRFGVLDQDAVARGHAGAGHDRGGGGQPSAHGQAITSTATALRMATSQSPPSAHQARRSPARSPSPPARTPR
jgi:hypothetical protein